MSATHQATPIARRANGGFLSWILSPWATGTAITFAFYAALPYLPVDRTTTQRYFCGHWIEYATTGLFFVGMVALLYKSLRVPFERAALNDDILFGLSVAESQDVTQTVDLMENHLRLTGRRYAESKLMQRLLDVCGHVRARRSADALDSHLSYLADLASGRLHSSYALIRTITWAVPILGFLGTVIGITIAIANVTPEQLGSSLSEVTSGLGVAFDTTALSLSLSMILVFMTFVVEKSEGEILDRIEDYGLMKLVTYFPSASEQPIVQVAPANPLIAAEAQAATKLLERSEELVRWQTELWQTSLEGVRQRWSNSFEQQHQLVTASLQQEMAKSLTEHDQQLAMLRSDVVQKYNELGHNLTKQSTEILSQLHLQHQDQMKQLGSVWSDICKSLREERMAQHELWQSQSRMIGETMEMWQRQVVRSSDTILEQSQALRGQGEAIVRLVEGTGELSRMEEQLVHNLQAVRVAESLEETLLNLNAAINLMTSRSPHVKAA